MNGLPTQGIPEKAVVQTLAGAFFPGPCPNHWYLDSTSAVFPSTLSEYERAKRLWTVLESEASDCTQEGYFSWCCACCCCSVFCALLSIAVVAAILCTSALLEQMFGQTSSGNEAFCRAARAIIPLIHSFLHFFCFQ
jgi:hypothetical protein